MVVGHLYSLVILCHEKKAIYRCCGLLFRSNLAPTLRFALTNGTCVSPGDPGSSCDDGDAGTFNDVYLSDSCTCAGTHYVNPDGSGPCEGTEFVSYKGYDYRLVEVGSQCWYQENVRELPGVSPRSEGYEDDGLAHAYVNGYTGSDTLARDVWSLYNFAAVEQWGLCPTGFHVPELSNFNQIISNLAMPQEAC